MKLRVDYVDGRSATVLATPRAQVETERHFRGQGVADGNQIETGYHLAWASLHFTDQEPNDFETWLNLVSEVNPVEIDAEDEKATDPTPVTPEPTGSFA